MDQATDSIINFYWEHPVDFKEKVSKGSGRLKREVQDQGQVDYREKYMIRSTVIIVRVPSMKLQVFFAQHRPERDRYTYLE